MPLPDTTVSKREALDARIRSLGRTLVAYSGGVDSAYLAWAAYKVLGADMVAVIADSSSLARTHLAEATAFALEQRIPLEVISTSELDRAELREYTQVIIKEADRLQVLLDRLLTPRRGVQLTQVNMCATTPPVVFTARMSSSR